MRQFLTVFAAIVLFAGTLLGGGTNHISGQVVGVHDGDTITLLTPAKVQVKVRLNGIDAPEAKQAFGQQAKQFLSGMVYGRTVRVDSAGKDRYGRMLGDLRIGTNWVNKAAVEAGMAWHYKQFSKSEELAGAEAEARRKRAGLWADKEPAPPWEFRKRARK